VGYYNSALTSGFVEVKMAHYLPTGKNLNQKERLSRSKLPDTSFLDADDDYGFSPGFTIYVQVKSTGAYRIDGIQSRFAARLYLFTE
jgi:hypothetical protein